MLMLTRVATAAYCRQCYLLLPTVLVFGARSITVPAVHSRSHLNLKINKNEDGKEAGDDDEWKRHRSHERVAIRAMNARAIITVKSTVICRKIQNHRNSSISSSIHLHEDEAGDRKGREK